MAAHNVTAQKNRQDGVYGLKNIPRTKRLRNAEEAES